MKDRTVGLLAASAVVDTVAVAAVEPGFGAEPPLHEPRKVGWKGWVEPPRIDVAGDALDDGRAVTSGTAARTIGMAGTMFSEDAGAVQKIVHQGIDRERPGRRKDISDPAARAQ